MSAASAICPDTNFRVGLQRAFSRRQLLASL